MTPLLRLPLARLTGTPRSLLPIAGWTALAIVAALVARDRSPAHAADHALLGTYGALVLPLLAYAAVGAALGGKGLLRAGRSLAAFGASPAHVAANTILAACAATAVLGGAIGAVVAALAHGSGDPPMGTDVVTCLWIGALGGTAYAAYFMLGSAIGKTGMTRSILLVLDFVFGSGTGAGALLFPRAHVRNLFGGLAPAEISQRASTAALIILTLVFATLAVFRARRAR